MRYEVTMYDRWSHAYRIVGSNEWWVIIPPNDGKQHWGLGTLYGLFDRSKTMGEVTRIESDAFGRITALEVKE